MAGAINWIPTGIFVSASRPAGTLIPQSPERFSAVVKMSERYIWSGSDFSPNLNGGTGLTGVAKRLSTFDGRLNVSSPAGGPTLITMKVPAGTQTGM